MSEPTLKERTVSGVLWSFSGTFLQQGLQFVVGIILARLLLPEEFGLIGMIMVFIVVSNSVIDAGFSQALIQRKNATQIDYDTVFYFNIVVSFLMYGVVYVSAGWVARFFAEPQLIPLLRILSLSIIINAFSIIHRTIITKEIDFKTLTRIQVIASFVSGAGAIFFASFGFGVWSLVLKNIVQNFIQSTLYWYYNKWIPKLQFSIISFKSLFSFGSKLLISGLISALYQNLLYVVIGRYFSAADLGLYTRANIFKDMASKNITGTVQRVTYPALASIQDDAERLKRGFRRAIQSTMFITFPLLLGLAVVAEPLILLLIGDKWMQSIPYLQLLCFAGMLYPLHAMNLNILKVKGRSDLFLRLEILKKLMVVPIIVIAIRWGIIGLIGGLIVQSTIAYFINSYYSGRLIGYTVPQQLRDIAPGFFISVLMAIGLYVFGLYLPDIQAVKLSLQIIMGVFIYYGLSRMWNVEVFGYFTDIAGYFIKKLKVAAAR